MRIHFATNGTAKADAAVQRLQERYGHSPVDEADYVVALGGDGMMLQILHRIMGRDLPVYGMNFGSVGFLMNSFSEDDLLDRLKKAQRSNIYPLIMEVVDAAGSTHRALALNEVSIFRATHQAAKLEIIVDGNVRISELICDGVLISTPAGSTAYNFSAHGPILPLDANLLALTPISPFRPRRWRGALLSNRAVVKINITDLKKRPVNAVADNQEFIGVQQVLIREDRSNGVIICFDAGNSLEERILSEQFMF
jgi:NAD+ kinase